MEELPSLYDLELQKTSNGSGSYQLGSYEVPDDLLNNKQEKLQRAQELKEKRLYRKSQELNRNADGSLVHDSDAMIRIKELANAGISGVDWLLEASENIVDLSQGDAIDRNDRFMANNQGKQYSMENKDFIAARETTTDQLIQDYRNAKHDPNSDKGIYTLRKFDGYNPDGSAKYIYKYGLAEVGADTRYREQYVQDGFDIVEEKRFAGAEDWEKTWNASQDVLDHRVFDSGSVEVDGKRMSRDEASGVNFGAGKTELLDTDLLGTDIGKTEEDYKQNQAYSKRLSAMADARWQSGMSDSVVDAFQSGAAKTLVDTADFILDVITPFGDNTLLNDAKKQENIDKWVGYDRTQSTQALSDAATYWKQGDYLKAVGTVITDPNTMVESLPMALGMFAGFGKFTKGAKLLKDLESARKAGKSGTEVAAIADKARKSMSKNQWDAYIKYKDSEMKMKILDHANSRLGFHTMTGVVTNNILDERIANKIANGEPGEVSMGEVISTYALQLPLMAIDRLAFSEITGLGKTKDAIRTAFKMSDEAGKKTILQKLSEKTSAMIASGAGEGAQEYAQTWGEILGANVGIGEDGSITAVFNDEENQHEALMGGLGGLAAGAQMKGAVDLPQSLSIASDVAKRVFEGKTTKALRILKRSHELKNADFSTRDIRIKAGNMLAGVDEWRTDNMTKDFSEIVDTISEKFSMVPSDKVKNFAAGLIVKEAFNALKNKQDRTEEDTKKFAERIRAIHNDPTIDFSMKSLVEEDVDASVNKFMEILQADYSTREEQDAAILEAEGNLRRNQETNIADPIAQSNEDMEGFSGKSFGSNNEEDAITKEDRLNNAIDRFIKEVELNKEILSAYVKEYGSNNESVSGSAMDDDTLADYDNLINIVKEYRKKGKKNVQGVANELASIGFIQDPYSKEGIVISRASMRQYERDLTKAMLDEDPDIASGLLDEKASASHTSLEKLREFANSRLFKFETHLDREGNRKKKVRKYNIAFLQSMEKDNAKMLATLDNLLEVAKASSKVDDEARTDYIATLEASKRDVIEAQRRTDVIREKLKQKLIKKGHKPENIDFENEEFRKNIRADFIFAEFSKDGKTIEVFSDEDSTSGSVEESISETKKEESTTPEQKVDSDELLKEMIGDSAGDKKEADTSENVQAEKAADTETTDAQDLDKINELLSLPDEEFEQVVEDTAKLVEKDDLRQKQVDQLDAIFEQEAVIREKINAINATNAIVGLNGLVKTLQKSINKDLDDIASLKDRKKKASKRRKDIKENYSSKENGETVWMLKKAKELFTKIWHKIRQFSKMIEKKQNDILQKEAFKQEVQAIIDALDPAKETAELTVEQIQKLIDKVGLDSNMIPEAEDILAENKKAKKLDTEYKRTRKEFSKEEDTIRENITKILLDGTTYTIDTGSSKFVKVHDGDNDPIVIEYTPEQREELRSFTQNQEISEDVIETAEIIKIISDAVDQRMVSGSGKSLPLTMLGNIKSRFERFGTRALPKIRTSFKINKKLGIFATMNNPFSSLLNADITPAKNAKKVFSELMKQFPESIKSVILNSKEQQDSLRDQIDSVSGFMNQLVVPREKVRNLKATFNKKDGFNPEGYTYFMDENGKIRSTSEGHPAANYLSLFGTFEENVDDQDNPYIEMILDPRIEEIVKFYAAKSTADLKTMLEELAGMDDIDLAKEFNLETDDDVVKMRARIDIGALPASSVIASSAKDAYSQLGISLSQDADQEIQEGIIATFEALIHATLISSDFVNSERSRIEMKEEIDKVNRDKELSLDEKRSKKKEIEDNYTISGKFYNFIQINEEAFDKFSENYTTSVLDDIVKAMNKLQYITEGDRRMPPSRTPLAIVDKFMLHTKTEMPKERQEYIKKLQETPWYFNEEVAQYLNLSQAEKRNVLRQFGYVDIHKDGPFQQDKINKIIAVNEKIEREFDILVEYAKAFQNENGSFDKFYLPWGETKSMRETVTSDLNPQESKLIRSLIYVDGHIKVLTKENFRNLSSKNDAHFTGSEISDTEALEIAMAQGFDLEPDKLSGTGTFKAIRDVIDIRGNEDDVFTFGKNDLGKAIEALVKDAYSEKKMSPKRYADLMNIVFEKGEGHHAVQSVKMLQDLYRWKKGGMVGEFTSTLTLESDAITSGMMLTLLQLGSDNAQVLLSKGGIYTSEMKAHWEAYTKKWLAKKYDMNEDDVTFDPGALIEAGNYHASLYDDGEIEVDNINEIFMDLYKTIGMHAKEKVEITKDRIEKRIPQINEEFENEDIKEFEADQLVKELNTLEAGKALLNVIGNLSGGTLRKLAKSPVMVYIYGASVSSIKKKLTHSIGKDYLIKSIEKLYEEEMNNKVDEKGNDYAYVASVIDIDNLDKYAYFKYDEEGKKKRISKNDLKKMDTFEKLMHIEFDESIMSTLENAVNLTFGDAFAQSFKENFSEVDKSRDIIKSIELLTFEVFKARLDSKVNSMMEKNNGIMSKKNFNAILDEINRSGLGHNAPNGDPKSKNVQPLMKMESSGSGKQASVVLSFDVNPGNEYLKNLQNRLSATLGTKVVIANTGAAPTITIHSIDGAIISKAIGNNPWLSIYDAIVQAADPKTMISATKDYSYATIEESLNRNILRDNLAKLNFMLGEMTDETERQSILERVSRVTQINVDPEIKYESIKGNSGFMAFAGANGNNIYFKERKENVHKRTETVYVNDQKIEYIEYNSNQKHTGKILKTEIRTYNDDGTVTVSERLRRSGNMKREAKGVKREYFAYQREYTFAPGSEPSIGEVMSVNDLTTIKLGTVSPDLKSIIGKQFDELIPSKSGADLKNDLRRLFLSLETIISNIEFANGQLRSRFENEKQAYYIAHAWIFGGAFAEHKGRNHDEEFVPVDTDNIMKFLAPIIEKGRESEELFAMQEMDKILEKSKKKSVQSKDKGKIELAYKIAKKIDGAVEYIGSGSKNTSTKAYGEKVFGPIGRLNTGAYNSRSVVFVSVNGKGMKSNPLKGRVDPFNRYGELQGKYVNLKLAIEAGSSIVMDTPAYLKSMESDMNGYHTTSAEEILDITGGTSSNKNYNIGEIQIANYLRENGYDRDENGVWTPVDKKLEYTEDEKVDEKVEKESSTEQSAKPKEDIIIDNEKADKLRKSADAKAKDLLEMMKQCKG